MFYQLLKHTHSGLRWVVLILILVAIGNAVVRFISKSEFSTLDKKINLLSMTSVHIQLLIGIILYFISPKVIFSAESMSNQLTRFFLVEHSGMMILAVILITAGYSGSKKVAENSRKHRRILLFYALGLLIMLAGIPWPWMNLAAGWL